MDFVNLGTDQYKNCQHTWGHASINTVSCHYLHWSSSCRRIRQSRIRIKFSKTKKITTQEMNAPNVIIVNDEPLDVMKSNGTHKYF